MTETVERKPSDSWMAETPGPERPRHPDATWFDIRTYAGQCEKALAECNADKSELRNWYANDRD